MSIFKVSTSRQAKNIISIPQICAELVSFNEDTYTYNIYLNADPLAAVNTGGMIVRIYVLKLSDIESRKYTYFRGRTTEELTANLRKLDGLIKQDSLATTRYRSLVLGEIGAGSGPPQIDISSFISNDDIRLLKRNILPQKLVRTIRTRSVKNLNSNNVNLPVLSLNSNNPAIVNGDGVTTILPNKTREQMLQILYEGKIDPASLWQPTNTYVGGPKTTQGIKPQNSYTSRTEVQNDPRILNIIASQLTNNNIPSMQGAISDDQYIETIEYEPLTNVELIKTLNIPRVARSGGIGRSNFLLRFEVVNSDNKIFQVAETIVQHGANVNSFMPIFPPNVVTTDIAKPKKVTFNIEQRDKYAVGVAIYRRTVNANNILENSEYVFLRNVSTPITGNKRTAIWRDTTANSSNNYIYRFIPYTSDNVESSLFTSVAVKIDIDRTFVMPEASINKLPNYGIITYEILDNGINVIFEKYPKDIVQFKIYRKNKTLNQKRALLLGTKKIINSSNDRYSITDQDVKLNYVYEYYVELVYKNGSVTTVPNTIIVQYNPILSKAAVCNIDNIRSDVNIGTLNVTFDVNYSIQQNNIELIRNLMREQSLLAEYQDEITINRDNIESFLGYEVTRFNLTTGDIEAFGTIPTRNFSDNIHGPPKGVKPLRSNTSYRYVVAVHSRVPETLFPTISSAYKWSNPLALKTGTIISEDKHPEDIFQQGPIVDIKYVNLMLQQETNPYIDSVIVTKIGVNNVLIEWSIVGTLNKIDHFIIKNTVLNIKNVIAVAHNISNRDVFRYNYKLLQQEAGSITFSIVPIYYDYTIGTEVASNTLVI
jgi:hypothetical protein